MGLLTLLKAVVSLAWLLFVGCCMLFDVSKTKDEARKLGVKDLHEFVTSFAFGVKDNSSSVTWPAVKFVRDPPLQEYIEIREKELKELKTLFDEFPKHDNKVNVVYLLRLPGSEDLTELVRQYGNFAHEKHGVSTVITLNAEGVEEFRKNLVKAIIEIKSPKLTIEQVDLVARWEMWQLMNELRQLLQKRPKWLLMVENIKDPNIAQEKICKALPWPGTEEWGTGEMLAVTTQVTGPSSRNSTYVRVKTINYGSTLEDCGSTVKGYTVMTILVGFCTICIATVSLGVQLAKTRSPPSSSRPLGHVGTSITPHMTHDRYTHSDDP